VERPGRGREGGSTWNVRDPPPACRTTRPARAVCGTRVNHPREPRAMRPARLRLTGRTRARRGGLLQTDRWRRRPAPRCAAWRFRGSDSPFRGCSSVEGERSQRSVPGHLRGYPASNGRGRLRGTALAGTRGRPHPPDRRTHLDAQTIHCCDGIGQAWSRARPEGHGLGRRGGVRRAGSPRRGGAPASPRCGLGGTYLGRPTSISYPTRSTPHPGDRRTRDWTPACGRCRRKRWS
jgi:hypothetical protein